MTDDAKFYASMHPAFLKRLNLFKQDREAVVTKPWRPMTQRARLFAARCGTLELDDVEASLYYHALGLRVPQTPVAGAN